MVLFSFKSEIKVSMILMFISFRKMPREFLWNARKNKGHYFTKPKLKTFYSAKSVIVQVKMGTSRLSDDHSQR